jgi:hypothetical protein
MCKPGVDHLRFRRAIRQGRRCTAGARQRRLPADRARKEERILPGSVVRDAVKEKVEEIEAEQMRKVYKKERDQIKDEIIQAFLPRALSAARRPSPPSRRNRA